jgi:hypothetical protein
MSWTHACPFWSYILCSLDREIVLSKEKNGAKQLNFILKPSIWGTQVQHITAIERLLIWNWAGILAIIHYCCSKFFWISSTLSLAYLISCRFKQAEADCDRVLLLDRKVRGLSYLLKVYCSSLLLDRMFLYLFQGLLYLFYLISLKRRFPCLMLLKYQHYYSSINQNKEYILIFIG